MGSGNIYEPWPHVGNPTPGYQSTGYQSMAPSTNPTMSSRPQEYQTQMNYGDNTGAMPPPAQPGPYRHPGGYQPPRYDYTYGAPPTQQGYSSYPPSGVPPVGSNYLPGRSGYGYPPVGSNSPVSAGYGRAEPPAIYDPYGPYGYTGVPQQSEPQGDYYSNDDEMDFEDPPAPAPAPAAPIARRERDSRERHDEPRRRDRSYR